MNIIEKSESIRAGLRKGFQDGTSKMAQRRCYGYDTGPDGGLVIDPDEAAVVRWIFDHYTNGDSLGKIAAGLEKHGIPFPTGKPKWNHEAINKLLSNEKYTGRVLLQKTISAGGTKIKNNGFMDRYLCSDLHEAIISDKMFKAAQQEKVRRTKCPDRIIATQEFLIEYKKLIYETFRMAKSIKVIPASKERWSAMGTLHTAAYCRVSTICEKQTGSLEAQQQFFVSMIENLFGHTELTVCGSETERPDQEGY